LGAVRGTAWDMGRRVGKNGGRGMSLGVPAGVAAI